MYSDISGFWKCGPHEPVDVENTWRDFVRSVKGTVVEDVLPHPRTFENADFAFFNNSVVAELKVIETEFSSTPAFQKNFDLLVQKLLSGNLDFKPLLFGGDGNYPEWFHNEFVRMFRLPLQRILKKANKQLRETKKHFSICSPTGILLLVNDGFTSISPGLIRNLSGSLLAHSFSSIDCCIYLTVNRYVEIGGSDEPKLLWAPMYSDRATGELLDFVNKLGRLWFDFLEARIGPFTSRKESESADFLQGSMSIVHPNLPKRKT